MSDRRALLLVVLLAVAAYGNTLAGGFVRDDELLLTGAERRGRSLWSAVGLAFTSDRETYRGLPDHGLYYRPMEELAWAVNYRLAGRAAAWYHLVNVLLHAGACVLVWLLLTRLWQDRTLSAVGAAAFALHPVHVESVAWVAARTDPITTSCVLGAILLLLSAQRPDGATRWGHVAAANVCVFAGLGMKELAAMTPALALAAERACPQPLAGRLRRYLPFAVPLGAYAWLRGDALAAGAGAIHGPSAAHLAFVSQLWPVALTSYVQTLALPLHLCATLGAPYPRPGFDPRVLPVIAALVASVALALRSKHRRAVWAFAVLWFWLGLAPVLSLVPIKEPMADRFLYLPSIGFCAAVGGAVAWGFRRGGRVRRATLALALLVLAGYLARTVTRNRVWRNPVALYASALECNPGNRVALHMLGGIALEQGQPALAADLFSRLAEVDPAAGGPLYLAGLARLKLGDPRAALEAFRQALERDPGDERAREQIRHLEALPASGGPASPRP